MKTLHLIATAHTPQGECSPENLSRIFEQIAPDTLFEEIPPDLHSRIYLDRELPDSLEVTAVRLMKERMGDRSPRQVPVDLKGLPKIPEIAGWKDRCWFNYFEEIDYTRPGLSRNLRRIDRIARRIEKGMNEEGFAFINSQRYHRMDQTRFRLADRELARARRTSELLSHYREKAFIYELRETVWIKNIFEDKEWEKGLLWAGTSHIPSLKRRLKPLQKVLGFRLKVGV